MMRYITFFIFLACLGASCTLDKRLYRNGYYIHKNHTVQRSQNQERDVDSLRAQNVERAIYSTVDTIVSEEVAEKEKISARSSITKSVTISETHTEVQSFTPAPITATVEEPVREVKRSDRWKYAGLAVLAAVVGIFLGILIAQLYIAPWLAILYAVIVLGAVGYMIYRSIRAHYQFKKAHPEDGKQQPLQWLGRILLYLLALAGAGVIAVIAVVITALSNW
jgi:hypothetical protein